MAEKTETKTDKLEREYIIPLRRKWKRTSRYKRTNRAVKAVKEFLVQHMKIRDKDLKKIKIDKYLNEMLWFRGIRKPPIKVRIKAIKEGDIVRAELAELPEKLKFKKVREEKREKTAAEAGEKKKTFIQRAKERDPQKKEEPAPEETEEKKEEEKEKKAAVVEAGKEMEKAAAKKAKHEVGGKTKQPKHQQRKALAK